MYLLLQLSFFSQIYFEKKNSGQRAKKKQIKITISCTGLGSDKKMGVYLSYG